MRVVVVTGASRSGTTFLGGLLDRAKSTTSRHEFLTSREFSYLAFYNPLHPSLQRDVAARLMDAEQLAAETGLFVDVNCNLAFGLPALRRACPDAQLFHLVRDGRAVVASNWVRKMYTSYSKGISLVPESADDLERWESYDRFQRLAWQWNHTVSHLLNEGLPILKFERLVADYDYFQTQFLRPAGVDLPREIWRACKGEKVNGSRFKLRDLFRGRPLKLEWTAARERQFEAICGDTMRRLGYAGDGARSAATTSHVSSHQVAAE